MTARSFARNACLLGAATAAVAQLAAQERPTFRASTRLIEVPVIVTDRAGRPVAGLVQADFVVLEDGQPRPISFFEVRDDRMPPAAPAAEVRTTPGNTFSNVLPAGPGTATVVLLDRLNAAFDSQWFARKHLHRYLEAMRTGDRVALYVLDGGIRVLHDFSTNADSLRRALEIYQARVSGEYDASVEPPPDMGGIASWLVDPALSSSEFFEQRRSIDSFAALEELAGHLAGIGGRKSIVWLSEVFPLPAGAGRQEVLARMRRATRALSDAQAALYPVDARGLVGAITYRRGRPSFTTMGMVRGNIETMEVLAEETGGRAFANSNALDRSIARAVADSRFTYVLGYYPPSTRLDGRFHRVTVKVGREKMKVRHRAGYIAEPPPQRDQRSRERAIRAALEAPLQTTGVGLSARVTRRDGTDDVTLSIQLESPTLTFERDGAGWRAAVDVLMAQVVPSGRGEVSSSFPFVIRLTDEERSHPAQGVLTFDRTLTVQRNTHHLRVVARDVASGAVGSLVIPIGALTSQ